ncbi:hydrogenase maturation nickel metallochaperone HypA [Leptolyngbya iicbica]|uniref:Hydrogenase maturation factor HypA n=2 Tax=Cyanophyceae TaxID=3028117 RepID=A0A4V2E3A8_9CYAN|nr:hydrogenase maturation nickel metallochaperone HypA [Leptolyngbya sp. LK]RZM81790.1 hydrogenase maturation nickel metallochaperone HypA [Leptolyngbya sp. LK]
MHEFAITQNIVEIATEHAEGAAVRRISLEIGQLTAIMPDAIAFCFDVCAQGTLLEGATLEIIQRPGRGQCQDCGREIPLEQPFGVCDCGCTHLTIIQGEELTIKELETEALCA